MVESWSYHGALISDKKALNSCTVKLSQNVMHDFLVIPIPFVALMLSLTFCLHYCSLVLEIQILTLVSELI